MTSVTVDTKTLLLSLKELAVEATKRKDGEFYRNYLADNAVAVTPFGIFDKEAVVRQMSRADSPFKSASIADTQVVVLTPECGYVTYRATFPGADGKPASSVFVTTIYAKIHSTWKGVFYQQTPLPR
jgi:ketosteroid isomerase-like protein